MSKAEYYDETTRQIEILTKMIDLGYTRSFIEGEVKKVIEKRHGVNEQINPCPYCKAVGKIGSSNRIADTNLEFQVICTGCGARGPRIDGSQQAWPDSTKKAISIWNMMQVKEEVKGPPNFRIVAADVHCQICQDCKYLRYDEKRDPTQSRYCGKYEDTILSNYMSAFYVCDSFKDVEDE